MKPVLAAALALTAVSPAFAHDAQAEHAAHTAQPAQGARLNLDTPIETIVADEAGKAVLDADLPGVTTHEHYEMFKAMSLRLVAGYAPDKLTPEVLAKVEADLAKVK